MTRCDPHGEKSQGRGLKRTLEAFGTGDSSSEDEEKEEQKPEETPARRFQRLRVQGERLAEVEKFWQAVHIWNEALEVKASEVRPHEVAQVLEMKAQALMQVHEWDPAISTLNLCLKINPLWWVAHQTLGRAFLGLGSVKQARVSFKRACHLKPDDLELWTEDLAWSHKLFMHLKAEEKAKEQTPVSNMSSSDHFEFPPRRVPSQNLCDRLFARELRGAKASRTYNVSKRSFVDPDRGFYKNICPNLTIYNVEKPQCFLRKFTPDGKRFIAFSKYQTQLEIYLYKGPSAMNYCTEHFEDDFVHGSTAPYLKKHAFYSFFTLEHVIPLCTIGNEQLNRECSLFTEDGDFVIVASASYCIDETHPALHQLRQNNESVTPNPRNPLENYTLYSIEISEGILVNKIHFKIDKIFLSHNQGIYLYRNVLAVLSVQHQTIHLFKLSDGKFIPDRKIGRLLYEDDSYILGQTLTAEQQTSFRFAQPRHVYREYREQTINLLKHRILVFLFRRALALPDSRREIRNFYRFFDQLRCLRMWKMQLLDENHLLIKYAHEEVVTLRSHEPNSQLAFFVVYNFTTTEVLSMYENTSEELVSHYEHFGDIFRNININLDNEEFRYAQFTSSISNNIYANMMQQRFKQTVLSAKNGGTSEAMRRVLAQLPVCAQSFTSSPYLDLDLFSYDEKWISAMERPKPCGEHPVQFHERDTGAVRFRMHVGQPDSRSPSAPSARRLVAYIFHPTDPFAISVQKTSTDYVVNFHIRNISGRAEDPRAVVSDSSQTI